MPVREVIKSLESVSGQRWNLLNPLILSNPWSDELTNDPMWTTDNRAKYDRDKLRYPSDLTGRVRDRQPECEEHRGRPCASCHRSSGWWVQGAATPMGRRADYRLAQSLPSFVQGFRESDQKCTGFFSPRVNPTDATKVCNPSGTFRTDSQLDFPHFRRRGIESPRVDLTR
jgi:hypothetical protein